MFIAERPHRHTYKPPEPGAVYKFCRCGRRRKVVQLRKLRKSLQRKAEDLWRQFAYKRDGRECQVKKYYPELTLTHSPVLQVDHFFPRADKNLFFDTSNTTVVCANCNYLKSCGSRQSTQIQMALQQIVLRREGEKKFYEMCETNNQGIPNREWGREDYFRGIIQGLEEKLANAN